MAAPSLIRRAIPAISEEGAATLAGNEHFVSHLMVNMGNHLPYVDDVGESMYTHVKVVGVFDEKTKNALIAAFGSYLKLQFIPTDYAMTHSFMNTARKLMSVVQHISLKQVGVGKEDKVATVGETVEFFNERAQQDFKATVGITPTFTGRDANRFRSKGGVRYGPSDSSSPLATTSVTADVIVSLDVYDASIKEIVKAMNRMGAHTYSYVIIVPPDLNQKYQSAKMRGMRTTFGELDTVDYWFEENPETGILEIVMTMNDGALPYRHNAEHYMQLATPDTQVVTNKGVFRNELVAQCGFYSTFHVSMQEELIESPGILYEDSGRSFSIVDIFIYDEDKRGNRADRKSYKLGHVRVPTTDWNRLIMALLVSGDDKRQIQNAHQLYLAVTNSSSFATKDERNATPLSFKEQSSLILSAILYAITLKSDMAKYTAFISNLNMNLRQLEGVSGLASLNPLRPFNDIKATFSIVSSTLQFVLDRSSTWRNLVDLVTGRTLLKYLGLIPVNDFTPKVEHLGGLLGIKPQVLYQPVQCPLAERHVYSPEETQYIMTLEDYVREEQVEPAAILKIPEQFDLQDSADTGVAVITSRDDQEKVITEYINMCTHDIKDIQAAVIRTQARLQSDGYEYAKDSWTPASARQEEITVVQVAGHSIVALYGEETETVCLLPLNSPIPQLVLHDPMNFELQIGKECPRDDGFYFTTKDVRRFFNSSILHKMSSTDIRTPNVYVSVLTGVPGCGKTHTLLERWLPTAVVVVKTKTAQQDLYHELKKKYGDVVDPKRVRTHASVMMNGLPPTDFLMIEESTLMFGAEIYQLINAATSDLYKDIRLIMFGDMKQVHATARHSFAPVHQSLPKVLWNPRTVHFNNVTLRNPASMVHLYAHFYEEYGMPIYTTNKVSGGVSFTTFKTIADIPLRKEILYVFYTQKQKQDFNRRFNRSGKFKTVDLENEKREAAKTPEEAQGMTVKYGIIVRPDPKVMHPYEAPGQLCVAVSRWTRKLMLAVEATTKSDKMISMFKERPSQAVLSQYIYPGDDRPTLYTDENRIGCSTEVENIFDSVERANAIGIYDCLSALNN